MGVGNPQILARIRERQEAARQAEAAKIASGQIRNPLEVVQEKYGNTPLTATGRKALQAAQSSRVVKVSTLAEEAAALEAAYKAQNAQIESNIAQAEYRARAGAVGARSEAVKQQEQRAVSAIKGQSLGSIEKSLFSSSGDAIKYNLPGPTQQKTATNKTRALSAREQAELISSGKADNFFIGKAGKAAQAQFILSASQQNKNKKEFDPFELFDKNNKIATITGQSEGAKFDYFLTEKPGSKVYDISKDSNEYFISGPVGKEPTFLSFGKSDYKIPNPFGPPEKPEKQGPNRETTADSINRFAHQQAEKLNNNPLRPLGDIFEVGASVAASIVSFTAKGELTGKPKRGADALIGFLNQKEAPDSKRQMEVKFDEDKFENPNLVTNPIIGGIVGGTLKGIQSGKSSDAIDTIQKGFAKSVEISSRIGPVRTGTQVLSEAVLIYPKLLKGVVSLPSFKAITESGKVETISRSLNLLGKPIVTKNAGGISIGGPLRNLEKSNLVLIESTGKQGLEFGTQGKYSENILTSQQGLNILKDAGKALDRDLRLVTSGKQAAKIVKFAERVIPDTERRQAKTVPSQPLGSVPKGIESDVLTEQIIGKTKIPVKGTLAETMQLNEKFLESAKPKGPLAGLKSDESLRNVSTEDVDLDYSKAFLGLRRAFKDAGKYKNLLQNVAGKGRKYEVRGTNVLASEGDKPAKTVINIVTKRDAKTGYLNDEKNKVFLQDLGRKTVKFPTKGGNKAPFITLESQALRRLEASISLQGPKVERFRGPGRPDYLKPGFELQFTEKGYRFGPPEHALKHMVKNQRNFQQIADNLEKYGFTEKAAQLRGIREQTIKDYFEYDFGLNLAEPIEKTNIQSLASVIGSKFKDTPYTAGIISTTKTTQPRQQEGSLTKEIHDSVKELSKASQSKARTSITKLIDSQFNYGSIGRSITSPVRSSGLSVTGSSTTKQLSNIKTSTFSKTSKIKSPSTIKAPSLIKPLSIVKSPASLTKSPTSPARLGQSVTRLPPGRGSPGSPSSGSSLGRFVSPPVSNAIKVRIPLLLEYNQKKSRKAPSIFKDSYFIVDPADPVRPAVLAPPGITQLRSRSRNIFGIQDKRLARARNKRNAINPILGSSKIKWGNLGRIRI